MEYEFTFVVDGVDVDDDAVISVLFDSLDAQLARVGGQLRLTIGAEGIDAVKAAEMVIAAVGDAVPRLRLLRLDRDLVSTSDIAERTRRTRQNVAQWISGERHQDPPFPKPETFVGRSRVWLWSEVNRWLRGIGLADPVRYPTREEMTLIDLLLVYPFGFSGPVLDFHVRLDEREEQRREVEKRLMADPRKILEMLRSLASWNAAHAVVACAVPADTIGKTMSCLSPSADIVIVTCAVGDEGDVWRMALTSVPDRDTVPLAAAGLHADSTVGDLMLAHSSGRLDRRSVVAV